MRHLRLGLFVLLSFAPGLVAGALAQEPPPPSVPEAPPPPAPMLVIHHRPSMLMQSLYATTVVAQGLDIHSTFKVLDAGGKETNPIMAPLTKHRAAFIAAKVGITAALIYATHAISKNHKVYGAIALIVANSVVAGIAAHNYRVAKGLTNPPR